MIKAFTRRHWLVAAALFTCVIVLGASRMAPRVSGVYHDDGIYVATGKAIAEGKGYHLINLPGEPAQTKYPFLYPAVLSVFWKMWPAFPDNLALLQRFSLLCSAIAIAISFLYLVRFGYFSDVECAIAGIICATSPLLLYFSTLTLSEPFFAVLLTCGLWMGEEVMTRRAHGSRRENWVAGVIIALPFLCRVIAAPIAVLCAVLVASRKRSIWVFVGAACAMLPWVLWIAKGLLQSAPSDEVTAYYTVQPYFQWWLQSASDLVRIIVFNLFFMLHATATMPVQGIASSGSLMLAVVVGAVTWSLIIAAWCNRTALVISLLAYAALILIWPWPPARFLVPLLPLTTIFLVRGSSRAVRALPGRLRTATLVTAVVLAIGSNLLVFGEQVRAVQRTGYPHIEAEGHDQARWTDYQRLFRWIRENTAMEDVLASGLDSMLYLYTGRQAVRPFESRPRMLFYGENGAATGTVEDLVSILNQHRAKFLVKLPMPGFAEEEPLNQLIEEAVRTRSNCLREEYRVPEDTRFVIYEVRLSSCSTTAANPRASNY
jgi:hypothetical protein